MEENATVVMSLVGALATVVAGVIWVIKRLVGALVGALVGTLGQTNKKLGVIGESLRAIKADQDRHTHDIIEELRASRLEMRAITGSGANHETPPLRPVGGHGKS